ncbi:MAG: hypothetical protein ACI4RS_02955 [Monoglobaceae bacterium]
MKRISLIILCIAILTTLSACGKRQNVIPNQSASDISAASDDENKSVDQDTNVTDEVTDDSQYSEEETEEYVVPETGEKDFRSEKERIEINNNLRDVNELINDECYDDALMIIQSLKTRKLSKEESEKLTELQEQLENMSK